MKILLLALAVITSFSASARTNNLPDTLDDNNVKASEEKRAGEIIDSRDSVDLNDTPANMEQRQEDEKPEADWENKKDVVEEDK